MGEIRIVGTGETHGYPYLVCKKRTVSRGETFDSFGKMFNYILLIPQKPLVL